MWQMTCPRRHPGLRLLTGKDDDVMFVCVLINLLFDNMNMLIDFLLTGLQSHPPSYARGQQDVFGGVPRGKAHQGGVGKDHP